ncbi:acyl-CoA dehydrogenase family protein [Ferrimicrobium sp.]|uniref:acyl-CoA dehydrogenase family protein n=2 Tax=Ferrimicrobium sp. TaxID=2926050 RepID=UPI00261267E3|nr:acyl-CoA dehydrogenase family protein [Ferrimicrobium sp.]
MMMTDEQEVRQATLRLLEEVDFEKVGGVAFRGEQYDRGLAFVHHPVGLGGLAASPALQGVIDELLANANIPPAFASNPIGVGMGAPTVMTYGSVDLQQRLLRPLFTGEEIWCQLFSEPGAGSDVASLATRAIRDGDEWILNGQKVWTTLAHVARWGMLVARSDPEAPKHRGLTYFVLDMRAVGVEVRPLRQITGEAEFNEVYLTDVRIPDTMRLGDIGRGWSVAITTLMNERASIGGVVMPRSSGAIAEAIGAFRTMGSPSSGLDQLMQLWCSTEALRLTSLRAAAQRQQGNPGPEGSVVKLANAELNQKIYEYCIDIQQDASLLYPDYTMRRPEFAGVHGDTSSRSMAQAFLRSRANTIEGGTSEVMRNILGERVLGLPGEPRSDKELPWSQIPR